MPGAHREEGPGSGAPAQILTPRESGRPPTHTRHVGPRESGSAAPAAGWPWLGSWPGGDSADIQVSGRTAWEGRELGVMGNVAGAKETPNCPPPILGPKCKLLPSPHSIYGAVATYKRLGMGMCVNVGVHVRGWCKWNDSLINSFF